MCKAIVPLDGFTTVPLLLLLPTMLLVPLMLLMFGKLLSTRAPHAHKSLSKVRGRSQPEGEDRSC
jgi:hypothetical protein